MTDSPPARVLRAEALAALRVALDEATSPDDFLAEADRLVADPENTFALPGQSSSPRALTVSRRGTGMDAGNGPLVYEDLGPMDRANAADPRLWTCLALSSYREYMEQRWPLESDKWKNRVQDRWVLENASRGRLVRHGIARLWWISHLTRDASLAHPLSSEQQDEFAYTRAALANEDRVNAIFDREVGGVAQVRRSVLELAAGDPNFATEAQVRALMKRLTLVYGYRDLALVTRGDLNELIEELNPAVRPG